MIIKNEKKIVKTYELSEDYLNDFLFEEKLKSALYRYGYKNLTTDFDLLKNIVYGRYNIFNIAMLYYIGLSLDINNSYFDSIQETLRDNSDIYNCHVFDYEYDFLEYFKKIPFNFEVKKIKRESQLKEAFNFIGVGILSTTLLSFLYSDIYADMDSNIHFDDYISELSERIINDYSSEPSVSVCDFVDFEPLKVHPNNFMLLTEESWGFELSLLSIESSDLDKYIDSKKGYNTDLNDLKDIIESIYINLAPEPYRISKAYIIDSSNPLFNMFENKNCKYRVISLAIIGVSNPEWDGITNILKASKIQGLIRDIDKFNQIIISC